MVRCAIVGLGRWGQTLVNSVQGKSDKIRFVRGVTRTPKSAATFAADHGFPLDSDYEAALADPKVDAVVLTTPHSVHAEQIALAAKAKKHVFVDKPVTLTRESAVKAVAAAKRAGIVLAAGHNRRFLPALQELKRLIDDGALGTILHLEGNMSGPGGYRYRKGMWRADPVESPAGGMGGSGIHMVDSMIYLVGPVATVQVSSFRLVLDLPIDDTTTMLLRFKGKASGYVACILATAPAQRLQVFGSKGWGEIRGETDLTVCLVDGKPKTRTFPTVNKERAELEAFAATVNRGVAYPVPLDDVVHGVSCFETIGKSAKTGELLKVK